MDRRPAKRKNRRATRAGSYGRVAQAKSLKVKRKRKGALGALAVVLLFAAVAVLAFPQVRAFITHTPVGGPRTVLTQQRVDIAIDRLELPAPDLSSLAYVDAASLIGPRFEDVVVGEVQTHLSGSTELFAQKVTATAHYTNKSVKVTVPISFEFTYDDKNDTWEQGPAVQEGFEVQPVAPPSATAIANNIEELLASYNSQLAAEFEGASSTVVSELTAEGGTMEVNLLKSRAEETATMTVTCKVDWSAEKGWVPVVVATSTPKVTDKSVMSKLNCKEGALVRLQGTLAVEGSDYLLRLDGPMRLTMDGRSWDLDVVNLVPTSQMACYFDPPVVEAPQDEEAPSGEEPDQPQDAEVVDPEGEGEPGAGDEAEEEEPEEKRETVELSSLVGYRVSVTGTIALTGDASGVASSWGKVYPVQVNITEVQKL
ncbi:hypothetical protein [Parvibacter caecicola]|uniref:Uncharacterized protein n=1 Tax=Parvibacter caecicola TaxID=747645 RepID=A0A4T9T7K9_9ACTN|nr:hypothetical protein [Parvibacter caecicola]MBB3171264.1 hypothetical protein [Parvibacter caecicola]MCR2041142.1 hypothetical protein [Parvibacter caecicola]TJW10734.1 hypothetical protein E5982_05515 [Parvibacter caecicola]